MSFFIDDGSNITTELEYPQGTLKITFRPVTYREYTNWLQRRESGVKGDVDCETVAKRLVSWSLPEPCSIDWIRKMPNNVLVRLINVVMGDEVPSPDKALGN